jgi:hypothetical protein
LPNYGQVKCTNAADFLQAIHSKSSTCMPNWTIIS